MWLWRWIKKDTHKRELCGEIWALKLFILQSAHSTFEQLAEVESKRCIWYMIFWLPESHGSSIGKQLQITSKPNLLYAVIWLKLCFSVCGAIQPWWSLLEGDKKVPSFAEMGAVPRVQQMLRTGSHCCRGNLSFEVAVEHLFPCDLTVTVCTLMLLLPRASKSVSSVSCLRITAYYWHDAKLILLKYLCLCN